MRELPVRILTDGKVFWGQHTVALHPGLTEAHFRASPLCVPGSEGMAIHGGLLRYPLDPDLLDGGWALGGSVTFRRGRLGAVLFFAYPSEDDGVYRTQFEWNKLRYYRELLEQNLGDPIVGARAREEPGGEYMLSYEFPWGRVHTLEDPHAGFRYVAVGYTRYQFAVRRTPGGHLGRIVTIVKHRGRSRVGGCRAEGA